MSKYFLIIGLSYLIGSIPFSYITAKVMGNIDIRNYGSGNTGATNVYRTLGAKAGFTAFFLDFLKGFVPAILAKRFFDVDMAVLASVFAVVGHCYSFWLGFKGGKGVATTAGTIFALSPILGLILLVLQFVLIFTTRIMSLASISTAFLFPIMSYFMATSNVFVLYATALGIFVIYKHKANIKRLLNGTESKMSFKKK
ncbi:glycerol-3-phosphate 1-O-acyltransferase PlsY [Anaeromicrobium sediminis]|uniref:Glycerol-3-phosphate acyltransferase n=1 Tax=Anaeromicrobium sediminis TaxID=1478221 RepID=A0A267MM46_9FIRM|nr:glycerol-3-phosphate 1-O-acyltransferase PlsY [Anaeromicrobium sediminis]PAB60616.1 acyl-phosphate glycerol 3-phosphate acyltransferase [Anaeromicrobium sediminis]